MMNKNSLELIQLLEEKGINWISDVPTFVKHGIYCKKILVEKNINGIVCSRAEYVFKQFKINFSQENLDMLINKYWDNNENSIDLDLITC